MKFIAVIGDITTSFAFVKCGIFKELKLMLKSGASTFVQSEVEQAQTVMVCGVVTDTLAVDRFRDAAEFHGYNKDIRIDRIRPLSIG